jgi:hypothetical protein
MPGPPWKARNMAASDFLLSDDYNNLHYDDTHWGGNVDGGGYQLSNVVLVGVTTEAVAAVTSVFGRGGDVLAQSGDYTAAMVGAVPTTRQVLPGSGMTGGGALTADVTLSAQVSSVFGRIGAVVLTSADISGATPTPGVLTSRKINTLTGSGLSGGGPLSADLNLAILPNSVNQQVQVLNTGAVIGTRHAINLSHGSNITMTVVDNGTNDWVDVNINAIVPVQGLVDPTTTPGDIIARGPSAPAGRLAVGSNGQVLTVDTTQPQCVKWASPAPTGITSVFTRTGPAITAQVGDYTAAQVANAVDQTQSYNNPAWITSLPWAKITNPPAFLLDPTLSKGDLIVHGTTTTRLPVGADGSVLTADSTTTPGVKWGGFPVTTVFGRAGAVVATATDYTVGMIAGAVPNTLLINTPAGGGLTGGGNLSANRSLSQVPDSTNQQVQVLLDGQVVGLRHAINFQTGAGVSLSITDNNTSNRIDCGIASSGGTGGGLTDPTQFVGDLIVRGSAAVQRLPVGLNGQVLTADSTQALGVKWAAATGGSGSQSPWITDINAAGYHLNGTGAIGVNSVSVVGTARVYVVPAGTEEGVATVLTASPGLASMKVANDVGDYLRVRSYGTGYPTTPALAGLATLEASNILAISANAAEVMRLTAGHVLIGTTVDDTLHMLQVNGTVKSATGGFVFPDGTTQTSAFTPASSAVTSVFGRTGAVVAKTSAPFDYSAANVTNAVDSTQGYANPTWITSLAWSKITGAPAFPGDPTTTKGDLIGRGTAAPATRLAVGTDGQVLTADSTQTLGVRWGTVAAAPVTSVFTRTGAVTAASGDYTAAQVTNAVDSTGSYANPTWITSLAWSKITGAPATGVSSVFTRTGAVVAAIGDYTAAQITNAVDSTQTYADPAWITALSWSKITGAPAVFSDPTTTKGDIIARGTTGPATRLAVGTDTWVLTADSTQTLGVKWAAAAAGSPQSPWASNIDAASHYLGNVSYMSIGIAPNANIPLLISKSNSGYLISIQNSLNSSVYGGSIAFGNDFGAGTFFIGQIGSTAGSNPNACCIRSPSQPFVFIMGTTPLMTLSSSGSSGVSIGNAATPSITNPAYALALTVDSAGKPSTNTWTIASDSRLKRNIKELVGGLDIIKRLRPIEAEYNGMHHLPEGHRITGFLAEEIRDILPGTVTSHRGKLREEDEEETEILDFNIHEVLIHLILAVKQLAAKLPADSPA